MNDLKFRVWDKDAGEHVYDVGIDINGIAYKPLDHYDADFCFWPDAEIEQFTGVYDRIGTPIYVGDRVEFDVPHSYQDDPNTGSLDWSLNIRRETSNVCRVNDMFSLDSENPITFTLYTAQKFIENYLDEIDEDYEPGLLVVGHIHEENEDA